MEHTLVLTEGIVAVVVHTVAVAVVVHTLPVAVVVHTVAIAVVVHTVAVPVVVEGKPDTVEREPGTLGLQLLLRRARENSLGDQRLCPPRIRPSFSSI